MILARSRSFTLLELLVVVGIMATVAGALAVSLSGATDQAREDMTLRELAELKRAVLQFRADTGFFPRRGPFDLDTRPNGAVPTPAEGAAWFDSPANLSQLLENPLPATHALRAWDASRRRGWRGPYLARNAAREVEVRVTAGADLSGALLADAVPAAADRFLHSVLPGDGELFRWTDPVGQLSSAGVPRPRPYLLLIDAADETNSRIVGLGPNGVFESAGAPLVAGDDVGVYLLR